MDKQTELSKSQRNFRFFSATFRIDRKNKSLTNVYLTYGFTHFLNKSFSIYFSFVDLLIRYDREKFNFANKLCHCFYEMWMERVLLYSVRIRAVPVLCVVCGTCDCTSKSKIIYNKWNQTIFQLHDFQKKSIKAFYCIFTLLLFNGWSILFGATSYVHGGSVL